MMIASLQAEQDFLDQYRAEVLDYLNSKPGSEDRLAVKEVIDSLYDEWDTIMGNADALAQVWAEKCFCWI